VNRLGKITGLERVPVISDRWKPWVVNPFGEAADEAAPGGDVTAPLAVGRRSAASQCA
jgi:hypothetical protein